jgi:hypothetical protein
MRFWYRSTAGWKPAFTGEPQKVQKFWDPLASDPQIPQYLASLFHLAIWVALLFLV